MAVPYSQKALPKSLGKGSGAALCDIFTSGGGDTKGGNTKGWWREGGVMTMTKKVCITIGIFVETHTEG
jgi:hypothetical protein